MISRNTGTDYKLFFISITELPFSKWCFSTDSFDTSGKDLVNAMDIWFKSFDFGNDLDSTSVLVS